MAVPDFQTLMLPLLKLASDGQQHSLSEAVEQMAKEFQLSHEDQTELIPSGQQRLYNRIGWARTYLKKAGLLQSVAPGRFKVTDRGQDVLASQPTTLNVAFLESKFAEMLAFRKARSKIEVTDEEPSLNTADGTWNQRASFEDWIRTTMELSIPNEPLRVAALGLLASAIEAADEEGSNAWRVDVHRTSRIAGRGRRSWAGSAPTRAAWRRTGVRAKAAVPSPARNSPHRPSRRSGSRPQWPRSDP
jgi:hypothetical protein